MTLLDACEPLFRRICQLNYVGRTGGGSPDFPTLRREMSGLLNSCRDAILGDRTLQHHWPHLEMPLIFFVDSMIAESGLPAASEWHQKRLAYDHKELAGDQKFFDLLDAHLSDESADSTSRLGVFYTCIGLGFTGWYGNNPEPLRAKQIEILRRIDPGVRSEGMLKICPEAYENVDIRDLIEPPPIAAKVLLMLFIGLCLIFLAVSLFLYSSATEELRSDLWNILKHSMDETINRLRLLL